MRCHKDTKQKTTQAQKTPTTPTAATSAGVEGSGFFGPFVLRGLF